MMGGEEGSSRRLTKGMMGTREEIFQYLVAHPEGFAQLNYTDEDLGFGFLDCYQRATAAPYNPDNCNYTFNGITCWEPVPRGTEAVQPCPPLLRGVRYDSSLVASWGLPSSQSLSKGTEDIACCYGPDFPVHRFPTTGCSSIRYFGKEQCSELDGRAENATRFCSEEGEWEENANYSCTPLTATINLDDSVTELWFYFTGFALSLVAVLIAVAIFCGFRDLRCLRNSIHTNLMTTYVMMDFNWIVLASVQIGPGQFSPAVSALDDSALPSRPWDVSALKDSAPGRFGSSRIETIPLRDHAGKREIHKARQQRSAKDSMVSAMVGPKCPGDETTRG
ncbi:unnamed protein product [Cyprideis torosa]|uniref:Uncharacterized protein n=1 Tax=Cyprideis torosa TaxID=163714 RepID=A0A7R8WCS2_9CRUS|nr:unnamed protein product [Cyprideis torosa]CAG0888257.1 unnamed protein product [Cyprideis torosa]